MTCRAQFDRSHADALASLTTLSRQPVQLGEMAIDRGLAMANMHFADMTHAVRASAVMMSNVADAYNNAFRSLQEEYSTLMGRVLTEASQQLQGAENWKVDSENIQDKLDKAQADLVVANNKLTRMGKELQDCRDELFEANNKKDTFYEELLHERQDNKDKDIEIRDLRARKPTMEKVMMQRELDKCRKALTAMQTELMGTKATLSLKTTQAQQHQQDSLEATTKNGVLEARVKELEQQVNDTTAHNDFLCSRIVTLSNRVNLLGGSASPAGGRVTPTTHPAATSTPSTPNPSTPK